jgi:hypothetical protein
MARYAAAKTIASSGFTSLLRPRKAFIPSPNPLSERRAMLSSLAAKRAKIADQVRIDIISKTHDADNAAKLKEISRTFICELSQ